VQMLTKNFASAAKGVDTLSGEVTVLSKSVRGELGTLSGSAQRSSASISRAADQIGVTATQFGLTANELQALVAENRSTLVTTLDNLNQTVLGVQSIVAALSPAFKDGEFMANLQALSTNAAAASANLRNFSTVVGSSENMLLLQQTLDSARATFQNAQKVTSDLDELTGDPAFRQNIQRLVNGLGRLVSSSEHLRQQAQLAQMLSPAAIALKQTEAPLPGARQAVAPEAQPPEALTEEKLRAQLNAAEALQNWTNNPPPASPNPQN
jgi:phospholipid/cholesterol/gamma-HCH transport system substrate-binding protein